MRLLIAATLALASVASGFTDFHAMNPHHKRTELPDGRVHLSHDVHHAFAEHGSFFKAKYEAVHDKKWHFVELHNHDVDFMKHVDCGAGDHELHVNHPSKGLKSELSKQNYEWTVLTAHHIFHCGETAIFRLVTGSSYDEKKDRLTIHTLQASYHDVFEYLSYDQDTNHLEQKIEEEPAEHIAINDGYELPAATGGDIEKSEAEGHEFDAQFWKKIKKAAKKIVKVVKKVVKKAVKVVTSPIRIVKALATGKWEKDSHLKLADLKWNGEVTRKFSKWQFTGDFQLAGSATAKAGLRFRFLVNSYRVQLIEAYYYGSFSGGVRASLNAKIDYDLSKSKRVANIQISTITFAIGPVPVVIKITAPIDVGFDLEIEGKLSLNALIAVSGGIKQGLRYTRAKGFETINEKYFRKQRDFSPRIFRFEVVLVPWAQVMFNANINFIGNVQVGLRISGEAILKNSYKCHLLLQMNLQPVILAGANINLKILGKTIYKKNWGPKSLTSWKIPLINFCLPNRNPGKYYTRSAHELALQTIDGATDQNEEAVTTTTEETLGANETGTNWFGENSCYRPGYGQTKLQFSLQFLAEENYTQVMVTIMQNITTDDSTVIDEETGVSNYTYQMTNTQQTYQIDQILSKGMNVTMLLVDEPDPEDSYTANSTETILPNITDSFQLFIGETDIKDLRVVSESMFCGSVDLTTEAFNDDNSTFTIFASGESTMEDPSLFDRAMNYIFLLPVLLALVIIGVVIAVVLQRRSQKRARGAAWAKVEGEVGVSNDEEPVRVASASVNAAPAVPAAPAPVQATSVNQQDARFAAL